jgi:hypothetical protein
MPTDGHTEVEESPTHRRELTGEHSFDELDLDPILPHNSYGE